MVELVTEHLLPQRMKAASKNFGSATAYRVKRDGAWQSVNWTDYEAEVETAAAAMMALGVKPGQIVAILGSNRPEWTTAAHAAMRVRAAATGIYFTCSPEEILYIMNHSDSPLIFVDSDEQMARVLEKRDEMKELRHIVAMRDCTLLPEGVLTWDAFMALADDAGRAGAQERLDTLGFDDDGIVIYTSGTTGPPKGVVMKHRQLAHIVLANVETLGLTTNSRLLSYLPLAHIAEMNNSIFTHSSMGYELWFCGEILSLADYLTDTQPTVFLGVPRVWQKIQEKLDVAAAETKGVKGALLNWSLGVAREVADTELAGKTPGPVLRLKRRIADRLVLSKIRAMLGLSVVEWAVSSAAPIGYDTLAFFYGIGIQIYELYGQSENGPTSMNIPGAVRLGTVGHPMKGVEVRLAEDGEIMVRSDMVFDRYLKMPEVTAETVVDGWMGSGDLGMFDEDGFLKVTGRKKEIIITAGGKNISPKKMEEDLMTIPFVEHAMIVGEGQRFIAAVLTLSEEQISANAELAALPDRAAVIAHLTPQIDAAVSEINKRHAQVEQVRRFKILERSFSIETGELTPTMKLRRRDVNQNFKQEIEELHAWAALSGPKLRRRLSGAG